MSENVKIITSKDIFSLFKPRDEISNKGDFGRALLICGSYGMAGAAAIAAESCVLSGVGICEVICPHSIYPIVASQVKEAVFTPIGDNKLIETDKAKLLNSIKKADCIAIGCGLGVSEYTNQLLQTVIKMSRVPLIIDADGLNILSNNIEILREANCPVILTPHPGEMSRLCGITVDEVQADRMTVACNFAVKNNVILVLKGHNTIVALPDGSAFINESGNSGMATGGTGDMLCGIIAAFCAEGMTAADSAKAAVHIHGLSGDLSAARFSKISTTPSNMLKVLPQVFLEIEKKIQ